MMNRMVFFVGGYDGHTGVCMYVFMCVGMNVCALSWLSGKQ